MKRKAERLLINDTILHYPVTSDTADKNLKLTNGWEDLTPIKGKFENVYIRYKDGKIDYMIELPSHLKKF